MSDMRLIVAGAGGRMGRTLIHAIAAMDGASLAGAVEAAGSAVIGRDAGELAGLGKNGVSVTTEVEPLLAQADTFSAMPPTGPRPAAAGVGLDLVVRRPPVRGMGAAPGDRLPVAVRPVVRRRASDRPARARSGRSLRRNR